MNQEKYVQTIKDVRNRENDYDFLWSNEYLDDNIILLGLGGSYAYGTDNEDSDLDIRGIALNTRRNIILGNDFEQVVERNTDTTIYSFDKMIKLLCSCNPNTIEILGLRESDYIYMSDVGFELLDNKRMFLSQVAAHSFGGYANAQLRRLENKSARENTQTDYEVNILKSIENASVDYKQRYFKFTDDEIKLYVDQSEKVNLDSEIFMDINLHHYPLRDFNGMMNDMQNIIKGYQKHSGRNKYAVEHQRLAKHMMHLIRLYYMCFDILEKEQINTYRFDEHDLLIDIRNGLYLDENKKPTSEFYELVQELEKRLAYAKANTSLPETVNFDEIEEFRYYINAKYVVDEGWQW